MRNHSQSLDAHANLMTTESDSPSPHALIHPAISLAAGVVLYLLPAPLLPFLMTPIDNGLHALGLLGSDAGGWERGFAAAMVIRWLSVLLLLLYVRGVEREPLSSIGIRLPPWVDIPIAAVVGALTLVVGGGLYLLVHGAGFAANTQVGMIVRTLGVAGRAQVAINAAVVEELLFRGLLIERLTRLFGRPWLSAAASVILFVGSHYVTGSSSLVLTLTGDLVGGLTLVGLYMLRGHNVVTTMIAHAIINLYVIFG